jgi:type I restriction enzyme S subunit
MSSPVPDGWFQTNFGKLTANIKSGLSRRISAQDIGIPVLISGNIQNNRLDTSQLKYWYTDDPQGADTQKYILNNGDILLCFINSLAQIGKACIFHDIGRPAIFTTNLFRIQADKNCSSMFLYQLITHDIFKDEISLITKPAVNQASFTKVDLENIPVCIPPLPEQQKIAQILTSVDEVIEKTQAQIDKLKDLKTAMMQELLTKGIGHIEFKDSPVGIIPVGWDVYTVEFVLTDIIDYRGKAPPKSESGIPLITAKNIRKGFINEEPKEYIFEKQFDSWMVRGMPKFGDVFITTEAPLGNVAKVPSYKFAIGQRVLTLRPKESILCTDFLFFIMQSEVFRKELELQSTGSTVAGIKQSTFRKVLLPVPAISEQKEIAKHISSIISRTTTYDMKLKRFKDLKKALMQDLLTGKVRVNTELSNATLAAG